MKENFFSKFIFISQFGITTIASVLICVYASIWIQRFFHTGYWVVIVGILLGAFSMIYSFYRLYRHYKIKKEIDDYPPGSNDHV